MKRKLLRLSCVIAFGALLFAGCAKEDLLEGTDYNTLITVKGGNAKTSYNASNGGVQWTTGDKISVVRGNTNASNEFAEFTLIEAASDGTATFGGTIPDGAPEADYVAVYPSQTGMTNNGRKVTLTAIRTTQTLKQGSFGEGDNTSMGYDASTTMQFKNVGGLVKIAVRGFRIKKIRITSNAQGQKLSGKGTIDLQSSDLAIAWDADHSYNYVEAVAANQATGFDVSQGNTFYMVLPPCTLSDYTVTITDVNNHTHSMHYTNPITISRATVTKLGAFTVDIVTPAFTMTVPGNEFWYRTTNGTVTGPSAGNSWQEYTVVSNTYENGIGKVVLDRDLESLGMHAFVGNNSYTELYFSLSMTTTSNIYAIMSLNNLTKLEMPGISNCKGGSFLGLPALPELVIPAALGSLFDSDKNPIFDDLASLTTLRFMKSGAIYTLPLNRFDLDHKKELIQLYKQAEARGNSEEMEDLWSQIQNKFFPFKNCPHLSTIFVPQSLLGAYQADENWTTYMSLIHATFVGVP